MLLCNNTSTFRSRSCKSAPNLRSTISKMPILRCYHPPIVWLRSELTRLFLLLSQMLKSTLFRFNLLSSCPRMLLAMFKVPKSIQVMSVTKKLNLSEQPKTPFKRLQTSLKRTKLPRKNLPPPMKKWKLKLRSGSLVLLEMT